MYYFLDDHSKVQGPYSANQLRSDARGETLVSHNNKWIAFSEHPDFAEVHETACRNCGLAFENGVKFCTGCGKETPPGFHSNPPGGKLAPSVPPSTSSTSPHVALLNLIIPGLAQAVFGQVLKGVIILILYIATLPTVVAPLVIGVLSIVDGYRVGKRLRANGTVGVLEFFPPKGTNS